MEIILLEQIRKLGAVGDQVVVKNGYARNYLLPQGKAIRANKENRRRFEKQRLQLETRNAERRSVAEQVRNQLSARSFTAIRSAGETGQLYGSVSARDVTEIVAAQSVAIGSNQVELNQPIKRIGLHKVILHLHPEVAVEIIVNVARSSEEAARQENGEDLAGTQAMYAWDEDALRPEDFFEPRSDYDDEVTGPEGSVEDRKLIGARGKFTDTKEISKSIVRKITSDLLSERLEAMQLASKFLLSAEEARTMQTGFYESLSVADRFEMSALPERLYNAMFAADPFEARAAAYALVSAAPAYGGRLNPSASPEDLSSSEINLFRGGLIKLFADIGVHYFSYVDARLASDGAPGAKDVHVLVEVSRRLPFDIAGKTVLLDDCEIDDNRLIIGSPLAAKVVTQASAENERVLEGTILSVTADMTIPKDRRWDGRELPVTVVFNHCVETLDVPVRTAAE